MLPSVFPLLVSVPPARNLGSTNVYVPPEARVKLPAIFTVPPETEQVEPVNTRSSNHENVTIDRLDAPAFTVKLGAFEVVPPEVAPKFTVAVAAMFLVNPPVPVQVKPTTVAIDKTVVPAVVLVSAMLPEPKAIARVDVPEALKIPVLRVKPARSSVPAVSVVVLVVATVIASASVTVIPAPLIVVLPSVFVALVIVPELRKVAITDV